jgi:hypothetical protein
MRRSDWRRTAPPRDFTAAARWCPVYVHSGARGRRCSTNVQGRVSVLRATNHCFPHADSGGFSLRNGHAATIFAVKSLLLPYA